jgi:hypothetical protein
LWRFESRFPDTKTLQSQRMASDILQRFLTKGGVSEE